MFSIIRYDILSFYYKSKYHIRKSYLNYIKGKTSCDSLDYLFILKELHNNTKDYLSNIDKCKNIIVVSMNKHKEENN